MKKGYVNWKLVLVLVLGLCAIGATVVGLRQFNRSQRAERGLEQGLQAYEDEQWRQAASGLGRYLSVHQSDIDILLKYGHAQSRIQPFRRDQYAQAVNAYRSILRIDETHAEATESLVDLYLQAQVPGEAELIASRYLEYQYDGGIARRLATAQVMQRKFEQAAELLTDLVQRDPSEVAAYELLAHIATEHPELVEKTPRQWIEAAVQNNPENARAYILRSGFLARAGQREDAIQDLHQAAGCEIDDAQTHMALAASWLRLDDIAQAQERLEVVYTQDPRLVELWQLRAVIAARSRDPELSARTASQALEHLGDDNAQFLPYAVELFLIAGDLFAAQDAMDQLQDTDVNPGLVHYLDGVLAEQKGDWPRAMAQWREAVVQGYTAESVYLKLAEGAVRLEDRTSAIETLRRYINQNPRSFSAQLMLARIYVESRRWTEAAEYAAAAVRLNPDSKEAQNIHTRCRIEMLSAQPESQGRVDQLLADLITEENTLQNHLLAFRIALNREDWQQVQETLDKLNEQFESSVQVRIAEVEYALRRQQAQQAADILDQAIQEFPQASEPVILKAALLTDRDEILEALVILQEAEARMEGQDQRRVQLWMGDLYRRTGQIQDAVNLFSTLADRNPQDILARRQLLALSRQDADIEQLQTWVDEIKQIEGSAGRLWKIEQVSVWMTQGDFSSHYPQIIALMNENLTANPDDKQSVMLLARAHEQAGNLRLAVSLYQDTLSRHPDDIDLAIGAMGAMYRAEEFRQAEQLLSDLLAAGHTDPRLTQMELQTHFREGRLDTAEAMLQQMIDQDVRDSSAKLSLALLKTRSGQFDEAKVLIDELIAENPDTVVAYAALTDWHLRQDQHEQALAACNRYLEQDDTVDAYRLRCRVLLALGRTDQAIEDIEQIVQRAGTDAAIWLSVSELYGSAGRSALALEAAQKALSIRPESFDTQKRTATLLLANPQTQQDGRVLLEKALAQQPRDMQLRLRKAALLLDQGGGAAAEAVKILSSLLNEFPRLEQAWAMLTEWYLLSNQPGMAMDTVLRGLASLPESRSLMIAKARVEAVRTPSLALETLNQLARRFPTDSAVMEMQARLMQRLGNRDGAIALVRDWLASDLADEAVAVRMKLSLTEMLYQNGQVEQAEQIFEQLKDDENIAGAAMIQWLGLIAGDASTDQIVSVFTQWYDANPQGGGAVLPVLQNLLAGQTDAANEAAEQILRLVERREPDRPEVAYGLAMLRHMTGQKLQSVPYYERALELQPDNVVALNNLAWILSQDMGDHQKGLDLANRGLAQAPNYADLLDTRGMIYFTLAQYENAAADFQKATEQYLDGQTQKTVSTFHLAQTLQKLGRSERAVVEFYRARDLDEAVGGLTDEQRAELDDSLQ